MSTASTDREKRDLEPDQEEFATDSLSADNLSLLTKHVERPSEHDRGPTTTDPYDPEPLSIDELSLLAE